LEMPGKLWGIFSYFVATLRAISTIG